MRLVEGRIGGPKGDSFLAVDPILVAMRGIWLLRVLVQRRLGVQVQMQQLGADSKGCLVARNFTFGGQEHPGSRRVDGS